MGKFHLKAYDLLAMDFRPGLQGQTLIPFAKQASNPPPRKYLVTPNNSHATITPGGTSCLKSQYCSFFFQGVGVNEEIVTMPRMSDY